MIDHISIILIAYSAAGGGKQTIGFLSQNSLVIGDASTSMS